MPFSILLSIILSIAGLITIVVTVIGSKKLIKKHLELNHQKRILLIYFMEVLIILLIMLLLLFVWDVNFIGLFFDDWVQLKNIVIDSIGALVTSVIVVTVGYGVIRLLKLILTHSQNKYQVKNQKRKQTIVKVTFSIADYTLKIVIVLILLAIWGLNVLPALAGLGIIGLVLGFGAQDLVKDFIAGFFIVFEKHFDIGDIVEINGFKGEVIDIGLKTTKVMNWKKDVKLFNNSSVQNAINFSNTESLAIVEVGVSYNEDIDKVITILNQELPLIREKNEDIIADPLCSGVVSFGDSSVNLRVVARTKTEKHYGVERTLRIEIKRIMNHNNIEIPFAQIVIHNEPKND